MVLGLSDVDTESLYIALKWENIVKQHIQVDLDKFDESIKHLKIQQEEAYVNAYNNVGSKEEKGKALEKAHGIGRQIDDLIELIDLPETITITNRERSLLQSQVMLLSGRAGAGKTQLLATKTKTLLDANRTALLLVAGIYFTDDPIQEQITNNLRIDFSFEELIDVLETIGEKNNCIVPVFIDALNETWNRKLWKIGLPLIADKMKKTPMVRLVVSYRPEFEKLVLSNSMISGENNIVRIHHRGFEDNSIAAIREFLNHYGYPLQSIAIPVVKTLTLKSYLYGAGYMPTL